MASQKIIFVTGGNSGIGYYTIRSLLQSKQRYHILLGSRSLSKAQIAIEELQQEVPSTSNTIEAVQLDLTSDESIDNAYKQIKSKPGRLDTLINNAGATFDLEYLAGKISLRDCFNQAYDTNVAGTQVLTHTLMPLLLQSTDPRLIFVAGLSQITLAAQKYFPTPPLPAGWPKQLDFETIGYRCSKTALNMLMLDWSHKLKEDGVKVWGVGPGMLATNLGGIKEKAVEMGAKHASIGGEVLRTVVEGERDEDVGKLINKDGLSAY